MMPPNQAAAVLEEAGISPRWRGPKIVPRETIPVGLGYYAVTYKKFYLRGFDAVRLAVELLDVADSIGDIQIHADSGIVLETDR